MELVLYHDPENCVFCDIETQSLAKLKAVGGRKYAAHDSTRILTVAFWADGTYHAWVPDHLWTGPIPTFDPATVTPEYIDLPVVTHQGSTLPAPVLEAIE